MYLLAELFPRLRRVRLPLTRDQAMLVLLALMEIAMGIEVFTGHMISGTIVPNEWIPIIYGPLAGLVLLGAGSVARRNRGPAALLATLTFLGSIVVGLLGTYFHLRRAVMPSAPVGQQVSLYLLIWAPSIVAPLMFSLIGVLGISAVWIEEPVDSGILTLLGEVEAKPVDSTTETRIEPPLERGISQAEEQPIDITTETRIESLLEGGTDHAKEQPIDSTIETRFEAPAKRDIDQAAEQPSIEETSRIVKPKIPRAPAPDTGATQRPDIQPTRMERMEETLFPSAATVRSDFPTDRQQPMDSAQPAGSRNGRWQLLALGCIAGLAIATLLIALAAMLDYLVIQIP